MDLTYVDLSCLSSSSLSLIWSSLSSMGFSCAVKGALRSGESAMAGFDFSSGEGGSVGFQVVVMMPEACNSVYSG